MLMNLIKVPQITLFSTIILALIFSLRSIFLNL